MIEALQHFGIEIQQVEIYSLEQGNVDIEMRIPYCQGHGECEKIIAPMLSDILEEQILVKAEQCAEHPTGYCHVVFGSAKSYQWLQAWHMQQKAEDWYLETATA